MQKTIRQLGWFVIVGGAAAATHWVIAIGIVHVWGVSPLVANAGGWIIAFGVSFAGHHHYTFWQQGAPWTRSIKRFFAISATGFAANELTYAWLLHFTTLRYDVLLALILIGIAVATFILGRFWAFRHTS